MAPIVVRAPVVRAPSSTVGRALGVAAAAALHPLSITEVEFPALPTLAGLTPPATSGPPLPEVSAPQDTKAAEELTVPAAAVSPATAQDVKRTTQGPFFNLLFLVVLALTVLSLGGIVYVVSQGQVSSVAETALGVFSDIAKMGGAAIIGLLAGKGS